MIFTEEKGKIQNVFSYLLHLKLHNFKFGTFKSNEVISLEITLF